MAYMLQRIEKFVSPRGLGGKIIAITLTVSLALMMWNVNALEYAFAGDEQNVATQSEPEANDKGADKGEQKAAAEKASAEKKASEDKSQANEKAAEESAPAPAADEPSGNDADPAGDSGDDATDEPAADDPAAGTEEDPADTPPADSDDDSAKAADTDADDSDKDSGKDADKADYPAVDLSGAANGVTVNVSAPKGALPQGVKINVDGVSAASVRGAVAGAVDGDIDDIKAVKVSFKDADGDSVNPKKAVDVTVTSPFIAAAAADDDRGIDLVQVAGGSATVVDSSASGSSFAFETKNIQTLALAATLDAADEPAADEPETWTVTFYNRDGEVHKTVKVEQGKAIGSAMPATIEQDGYTAHWAIGTIDGTGSASVSQRIDSSYVPTEDTSVVPDYDKITRTVTFYADSSKAETVATKTVDIDTSYYLNDIPAVPAKSGYTGKWVYSGGDFNNNVAITADAAVWAEYEQNVFTVTFKVGDDTYSTDTYYTGDALALPADPVVEGKEFEAWYNGDTKVSGGEAVTSDLTINAKFTDQYYVTFKVLAKDTGEADDEVLSQYFRTNEETIGVMPQDPFVSGKVFEKWVLADDPTTEVTADTLVSGNMIVVAVFRDVKVYTITAKYFYKNDKGENVYFDTEVVEVEAEDLPYTITAPASTQTEEQEVKGHPRYYASQQTIEVTEDKFDANRKYEFEVEYVAYTAVYDFVYKLKDLEGDGYTEIERTNVQGVLGSTVTPTVKTYDYATLESAATVEITQTSGQELEVKYNRKNFQVSYETNGGSYVAGATVPYGTKYTVSTDIPTRNGYTFGGWYLDEGLTKPAGTTVDIQGNTTLYAKWNGATVNYTIVYMFEKYNDAGTESSYVYDNSATRTGTVGSVVQASSAPTITKTGWEKDTAKNETSSVTIAADGSSVLYVYYKLKEYTFRFNAGTYDYHYVTATLTGKGVSGTGTLGYTITVKLGQSISSVWPANVTGTYTTGGWNSRTESVDFNGWKPENSNTRYVTKRDIVTSDMLPSSGTSITYTAQWTTNAKTYTVNYWLQNADDDGYTKSEQYSQTYTSSSGNLSAKSIAGYTYDHGNSGEKNVTTYNFYYNRDTYSIDYFYGSKNLKTISKVKFDATITGNTYNWTPTAAECGVDSDYTFDGWYADSGLTAKYTFNTMPASNLVLYAKWNAPNYTVSFIDDDGTTSLVDNQTVAKYGKAQAPETNPTKAGYIFEGWYTTADGNDLFDWNTQITKDTTVYAHWSTKTLGYTVKYQTEDGTEVASPKTVTDPNLKAGDVISEDALAVTGYRPDASVKTLTLSGDEDEDVIIFIYSLKSGETGYTVKYIIAEGEPGAGTEVAVSKVETKVPGDTSQVVETAASVDYSKLADIPALEGLEFYPDEVQKSLTLTNEAEKNVLTFYYSSFKNSKITVKYVDMDGNEIAAASTQIFKVGKTFTLARTPISGWDLAKAVKGTSYGDDEADSSYKIKDETGDLTFTLFYQKKLTVTVNSQSKQYDGTALTLPAALDAQVTVEGLKEGHALKSVDYSYANADAADGKGRLNAGTATVTPSGAKVDGAAGNYYKVRYIAGTLTVTKINVTIRVEPDRWTGNIYDGTEKKTGFTNGSKGIADYVMISHDGYKAAYLDEIWATITGLNVVKKGGDGLGYYVEAQTDAGDYPYDLGFNASMLPQDDNYSVSLYVRPGRLQILPKPITITTGSAEKAYDGTALTNAEANIEGLVSGETATVKATGSQTEVGSSSNTYSIEWGTAKAGNYTITDELGTLTVTKATLNLTVPDKTATYNGEEQTGETTYKVTGLAEGHTLNIGYTAAKGTSVDTYDNGKFAETFTVVDADNNDVSSFYELGTLTAGKLTIEPKVVTVTAKDAQKVYDNDSSNPASYEAEVAGLIGSDTIEYTVARVTGENVGTYTITPSGETTQGNYTVEYKTGTFTITPKTVTVTADDKSKVYGDNDPGLTATVEGLLGDDTVTYTISRESGENVGTYVITPSGETTQGNYTVEYKTGTFTITKATLTITANDQTYPYNGEPQGENNATYTDASKVTVTGLKGSDVLTSITLNGQKTNVGEYADRIVPSVAIIGDATGNYDISCVPGKLTITKLAVTVTITGTTSTLPYDGAEHTVTGYTATVNNTLYNVNTDIEFSGEKAEAKRTNAGTTNMGLTDEQFSNLNDNFNVTFNVTDGYQEITKINATVTIVGNYNTTTYDGEEHAVTGYTATADNTLYNTNSDISFSGTASAARTDAGTTNMGLTAEQFANTNENFETVTFNVTDGYQAIAPIDEVVVTIKGHTSTVDYDGNEHSVSGYDVEISNPLYKQSDFTFTGTASASRTDAGTTNMGLAASQFTNTNGNFKKVTFNVTDGYQTIRPIDVVVTITGHNNTTNYDGNEHSVSGYDVEISNDLYKQADFTFSGTATASRTDAGTTNMGLTADQFTNNNQNFRTVTFNVTDGYQTIDPINVTVTIVGHNDTKDYDGEAHTVTGYTATANTELYNVEEDFTFSGTAEASRTEAGTTNMGLKAEQFENTNGNFASVTFNVTDGYQTITPIDVVVTIVGNSNTADYDGKAHTVTGYTASASTELYDVTKDFTFSGEATATRTDAGATNMDLAACQFKNTNTNFGTVTFNVTDGFQKIDPIDVVVTIVGANNTTDFDGEAHTVTGYTATANTELYDVTRDFMFTGDATATRTDAGTTNMNLAAGQFANTNGNFKTVTFNVTDGYQTIDPIDVTVTIVGNNDTTDYDGKEHTVTGYTATTESALYDVDNDFTFNGTASASRTDAGTTNMGLAAEQFTNTNTNFKTVTFNVTDGYQKIDPIDVTVTIVGANDTTEYDGAAHTVTGYTATASTKLYDVTKDFTFSGKAEATRTAAGTTNMGLTVEQFANTNNNFANVTFRVTDGYQTINPIDVTVTIVGANNTTAYDGEAHTVTGYTATANTSLYDVANDFEFTGNATATRTDAGTEKMGLDADQFKNTNQNFGTVTFKVTDGFQTINPIDVTVTITGHHNSATYDGEEHSVSGYDVEISNTLYTEDDFTFSGTAEAVRTDEGTTNMGLAKDQFANTNNNFATVTFNVTDGYQTIVPVDEVVVTIIGKSNITDYDGKEHSVSGYDVEISNPLYKEADFTFSGTAEATRTDAGTTNMGLTADQFENKNKNFAKVTFNVTDGYQTVNPIDVTVTITGHTNTADYDGKEHSVSGYNVDISNLLYKEADFTFSGTAVAKRTDAGTTQMGLAADQFANTNDNFKTVTFNVTDGYQKIDPIDVTVTITEHSDKVNYDGAEHTVSGYDMKISNPLYTENDFTFSGNDKVSGTDAGSYDMELASSDFANKNDNFKTVTFEIVDGQLVISPIDVVVTIVGNKATNDYDGEAHTVTGYTATAGSDLYDVEKDFTFSGTASATRTDAGTQNMGLDAKQFTNTNKNFANVTFEVTDGSQTINPIDVTVTITGHTATDTYDGAAHTVAGYDATAGSDLFDVNKDIAFSGEAKASQTNAGTANMGLTPDQFACTNPNFATVTFNVTDGYQTITKRSVTLTSADGSKVYDGKALTNDTVTVGGQGFAAGEGATYDVTGTQTLVGSSENTFTYTLSKGTSADNYTIETKSGTLTVTDGTDPSDPRDVDDDLVVSKAHEGNGFDLGERITFTIAATNVYADARDITLEEIDGVELAQSEFANVAGGATVQTTATYTVTEQDLLKGSFGNTVTAKVGNLTKTASDTATLAPVRHTVTVDKQVVSPKSQYKVGDTVNFTITVRNTGNVAAHDVAVSDRLDAAMKGSVAITDAAGGTVSGTTVAFDALAAGESKTIAASYTVVRADAGLTVKNAAVVDSPDIPGNPTDEEETNPVEKLYRLTIVYVYANGNRAANTVTLDLLEGEAYNVASPSIDGYSPNYSRVTGKMVAKNATVRVVYTANGGGGDTPTPTPGGPGTTPTTPTPAPAAAGAPAPAATPAPPAATVTIADDGTPTTEVIDDDGTPLASAQGSWSLFDLLATIGTAIVCLALLIGLLRRDDEQEDEGPDGTPAAAADGADGSGEDEEDALAKRRKATRIASLVPAAVAVLALLLTQDFSQPMEIFDQWSLLFGIVAAVQVADAVLSRDKKEDPDNPDATPQAGVPAAA